MPTNRAARALAEHEFHVIEVEDAGSPAQPATSAGLARAAGGPAPRLRGAPAPAARGRRLAKASSDEGGTANGAVAEDEAKNVYRLSELPADVTPAVSIAQGLTRPRPRGLQSSAMQVVEIASTIAGAAMTRVLDNQGDVSWELDQMPRDAIHPGGATTSPGNAVWQSQTISVPGLRCENNAGQETFADFEVTYKYNGASVGFIEVATTKAEDGWGWGLTVKETMTADPNTYDTAPPSGQRFAAVKLRFHFRFDHAPFQDVIGIVDLTLYGNGTFAESARWTQP